MEIIYKENIILQSLYKAATDQNIPPNTIIEFARIYGFQVDFQRDIRKEDKFQIMYEVFIDENNKISLPKYPKRIGVLTSSSGSVIHDIIHRIKDRFPLTQILLYPIPVQGKNSHIETIEYLDLIEDISNNKKPDLIIFARGGGSLEEMMPFNEIDLIKRVFDLKIPSISAIGHETDYTLLDLVCDLRAPTPTAAAELAVPSQVQIATHLNDKKITLNRCL